MTGRAQLYLYAAWVIALVGVLMSLYVSEVLSLAPCTLCWVQRLFLFPLALLLGIAAYRTDDSFLLYGMVLSAGGEIASLTHFAKEFFPSSHCGEGCGGISLQMFGYISFPLLGAIGFALIFSFLYLASRQKASYTDNRSL